MSTSSGGRDILTKSADSRHFWSHSKSSMLSAENRKRNFLGAAKIGFGNRKANHNCEPVLHVPHVQSERFQAKTRLRGACGREMCCESGVWWRWCVFVLSARDITSVLREMTWPFRGLFPIRRGPPIYTPLCHEDVTFIVGVVSGSGRELHFVNVFLV
jgi:hypothetical protein